MQQGASTHQLTACQWVRRQPSHQNCSCDERCRSRVAQRPRKFPIEVFRTAKCGWGVRSTVDLPKGTVLGVYTGYVTVSVCFFILNPHRLPMQRTNVRDSMDLNLNAL